MKTVFTCQPVKRLLSTTIRSARPVVLLLNILFRDQQPTIMLFGGAGTYCVGRKMSWDYEKQKPSPFLKKILRQSQSSTPEYDPKNKNHSFHGKIVSTLHWLIQLTGEIPFHSHFIHCQARLNHFFLSLQWRFCVVSRLWTRFSYSDSKRSRPGIDNDFTRIFAGSLELVDVPKTRLFEEPSSVSSS